MSDLTGLLARMRESLKYPGGRRPVPAGEASGGMRVFKPGILDRINDTVSGAFPDTRKGRDKARWLTQGGYETALRLPVIGQVLGAKEVGEAGAREYIARGYDVPWDTIKGGAVGAIMGKAMSMMPGSHLMHGSRTKGLETLRASERGPLGPGVYTTPAPQIAEHYAGGPAEGQVYRLPDRDYDIYRGHGHRTDEEWYGYKDDKQRLLDVAPPELHAAINKMHEMDGYPLYQEMRHLLGSDEAAQDLFKKAGFKGVSGLVDGPEVLLFGDVSLQPPIKAYHGTPKSEPIWPLEARQPASGMKAVYASTDPEHARVFAKSMEGTGQTLPLDVQGPIADRKYVLSLYDKGMNTEQIYKKLRDEGYTGFYEDAQHAGMGIFDPASIASSLDKQGLIRSLGSNAPPPQQGLAVTDLQHDVARDNKRHVQVSMHPRDFLRLTTSADDKEALIRKNAKPLAQYNKYSQDKEILNAPNMRLDSSGKIVSHEGRHRAAALINEGHQEMPVHIKLDSDSRKVGWDQMPEVLSGQYGRGNLHKSVLKLLKDRTAE